MKEIIKKIILENQNLNITTKARDFKFPQTQKIVTLIGSRRVGKSYILFNKMNELKSQGMQDKILYINFEDERLYSIKLEQLQLIIDSYFELFPHNLHKEIFIFFDEIQNIPNWELFIRRLYDSKKYTLFLTGSSSKLLSKEIATSLRGRTLSFTIFPLSFKEFLNFKGVELDRNYLYSDSVYSIKNYFNEYIRFGGFPEILEEDLKFEVLQSYLDLTIYKDLIERYKIRNITLLKSLLFFLLSNVSKEFSINSYYNSIKNELSVSRETIMEYNSYLEDINVIHFLYKFDFSLKKQHSSLRKVYSLDTGISNSVSFKFSEDRGRLLENIVFIELKRRRLEVYYHKEKKECDFIIKDGLNINQAIQVTTSLEDIDTRKRELAGLVDACRTYNLKRGLILTQDEEYELEEEGVSIQVLPLWKWLLLEQ
ncbi:MAG: ATP-binding protein [Candidatus Woesearchaeota archaeon]